MRFPAIHTIVVAIAFALVAACGSSGGNGTISPATNAAWSNGAAGPGIGPVDVLKRVPWSAILNGMCMDPTTQFECADGNGCCNNGDQCCPDQTCGVDCSTPVSSNGCPADYPTACENVCCAGACDSTGAACDTGSGGGTCNADGMSCSVASDCCSGSCTSGTCDAGSSSSSGGSSGSSSGGSTCSAAGTSCADGTECCTGSCTGGTCD